MPEISEALGPKAFLTLSGLHSQLDFGHFPLNGRVCVGAMSS
jgi:hypothetical protein